jgi:hypothetical protein
MSFTTLFSGIYPKFVPGFWQADGRIVYGRPVRFGNNLVEDLVLELEDGAVVRYTDKGLGCCGWIPGARR